NADKMSSAIPLFAVDNTAVRFVPTAYINPNPATADVIIKVVVPLAVTTEACEPPLIAEIKPATISASVASSSEVNVCSTPFIVTEYKNSSTTVGVMVTI